MFPGQQPDETEEKAPPCEACGRESGAEIWGHLLCFPCINEWRPEAQKAVAPIEEKFWAWAEKHTSEIADKLDEHGERTAAAHRVCIADFIAKRKRGAA